MSKPKQHDLNKVPFHMRSDEHRRNVNIQDGKPLCAKCGGTGNEFLSMYHKCPMCQGTGIGKGGLT